MNLKNKIFFNRIGSKKTKLDLEKKKDKETRKKTLLKTRNNLKKRSRKTTKNS